jgi:uncharacterized membrane protein
MSSDDVVLLDATLRPNPPLPPAALKFVLAVVAAINLAFALFFISHGAWLVLPFMGADIVLLAWAFHASVRAARRLERVKLTPSSLLVESHPLQGPTRRFAFNPHWVRVDMAEPPEHGSQLTLWSHGRGIRVGSFLAPAERVAFAKALKSALNRARATFG